MNAFKSVAKPLTWSMALLLIAIAAGCGGGGGSSAAVGAIVPGAACTNASPTTPLVTSSSPTSGNQAATTSTTGAPGGGKLIIANFNKAMNPATINSPAMTFTLTQAGGAAVAASARLDSSGLVATLTTSSALLPNTSYTVNITMAAASNSGTALGCAYAWTFKTAATASTGLAPVLLGAAAPFGGFGGSLGMTNFGPSTVITGAQGQAVSLGTTGASTSMIGFHDTAGCIYTETPLVNVGQVNGTINTNAPPPAIPPSASTCNGGTAATTAIAVAGAAAALAAYNDLTGRSGATPLLNELGGLILPPGLYATVGGFLLTVADLTLDARGDVDAVWIFQMTDTLTVGDLATPRSIILAGGAQPKNVFWRVGSGSAVTINAVVGGGTMVGTIIAPQGITFSTPGVATITTLNGRALALGLTGSITTVNTVINVPAP